MPKTERAVLLRRCTNETRQHSVYAVAVTHALSPLPLAPLPGARPACAGNISGLGAQRQRIIARMLDKVRFHPDRTPRKATVRDGPTP
jgi:hypothetical protein